MPAPPTSKVTARRSSKPQSDPRYQAVQAQLGREATRMKRHAPAAQKTRQASASAKAPPNERLAAAKAKVVDGAEQAPTPKPQPTSFKALLRAQIEQAMPATLGETEHFMDRDQAGALKGNLGGNVAQQKQAATGPVDGAAQQAPNPSTVPALPSSPLPAEPPAQMPQVDGAAAMPAKVPDAEVSLQASKQDAAQRLVDAKVKPVSLARANDARFSAVAQAQTQVGAQADGAPQGFVAREAAVLRNAQGAARGQAAKGGSLLLTTRGRGGQRVMTRQQQQAAKEEAQRKQVADTLERIFLRTKQRVETSLADLDTEVTKLFDAGVDAALGAMKTFVDDRLFSYKVDRYLSIPLVGAARWLHDQVLGLPAEVNVFYQQGRRVFQTTMDALIDRVANLVETRLSKAKAEVSAGQAEIKSYVASLPADLRASGQAAERALNDRFAELSSGIDEKKNELAASLAQKYTEAFNKADEALKQMQDVNKSLVQRFADKLAEVVTALLEFRSKLLAVLKKGQETIQLILDDPIGFLTNLLAAVKGGFSAFVDHIGTHLKAGFITWLCGSLAQMGITPPTDFSLPSILKLVLDVLGITYDKMRAKAVRLLGERAVSVIEKVAEYLKELITGGAAKLWEKVKEDLGNLKEMVIDAIQSWLIETVVKQAVTKIVSMFNPAGAIIQAVLAIYNVVMFVVERAQQLLALIEAVVNSLYAIATGSIGGAISWIEKALASAVPVVIGLLARLLGLSGITRKIQEFIEKIRSKVDAAIDKAIAKVVALVKKAFGAVKAGAQALLQWWKKKKPFSGAGESHTLQFDGDRAAARLMVHSPPPPKDPVGFVADFKPSKHVDDVKTKTAETKALQVQLIAAQSTDPADEAKIKQLNAELGQRFDELAVLLGQALAGGGDEGSETDPLPIEYPKRSAAAYPNIWVGPKSSIPIGQGQLRSIAQLPKDARVAKLQQLTSATKDQIDFDHWDGEVRVFKPDGGPTQQLPGGPEVGLSTEFASIGPGSVLKYDQHATTGGGHKINDRFKPYGYVPRAKGGEGLDGDHVMERQIGGPDHYHNLWPLDHRENRSSGATVKGLTVTLGGKTKNVHEAQRERKGDSKGALFLLITKTRRG